MLCAVLSLYAHSMPVWLIIVQFPEECPIKCLDSGTGVFCIEHVLLLMKFSETFICPPLSQYLEASKTLMYYPCHSIMYAPFLQSETHDPNAESNTAAPKVFS